MISPGRSIISGVKWRSISQLVTQVSSFAGTVALARLLSPEDFGLVAMVTALTGFASLIAELGLGAAIVHKPSVTDVQCSSVFWLNLGFGCVLSLSVVMLAPLAATFYGEAELRAVATVVSLTFLLNASIMVQRALLLKEMDFRALAIAEIFSKLGAILLAVGAAAAGMGYWSLVVLPVASVAIANVVMWRFSRWRPKATFSIREIRGLLSYGIHVLGNSTLDYWSRNLDRILIGRIFGAGVLGFYVRAYTFVITRLGSLSKAISGVLFPSMAKIQDDPVAIKALFLQAVNVNALLVFPAIVGIFVTAEDFVGALFGAQWLAMVPMMRALCLLAVANNAGAFTGALFLSQGAVKVQFRLGAVLKGAGVLGLCIGLRWGPIGVALVYGAVTAASSYPSVATAGRLIGLRYREYLQALAPPALYAVVMGLGVFLLSATLAPAWSPWARLACQVALGVVIYSGLMHGFSVPGYSAARDLLLGKFRRRAATNPGGNSQL